MTPDEIAAWDKRRSEELDVGIALNREITRFRIIPTPERIREITEAVLQRRKDEGKGRSKGG